jgi:uncharacterized protein (TIGR00369 family)
VPGEKSLEPKEPRKAVEYEAPFAELLDMRPGQSADGVGSAFMPIHDNHRQLAGVVQGGLIVTLADYAIYRAVSSLLGPGQQTVTLELKVNFIAPARDGSLTATARVISGGRQVMVADVEVTDQRSTLIARGLGTYLVRQGQS